MTRMADELGTDLQRLLLGIMARRRVSQTEVAALLGITQSSLSARLYSANPSSRSLAEIAEVLGVRFRVELEPRPIERDTSQRPAKAKR